MRALGQGPNMDDKLGKDNRNSSRSADNVVLPFAPDDRTPPILWDTESEALLVGLMMRAEDDPGRGVAPIAEQGLTEDDFAPGHLPRDIVRVALDLYRRGEPADDIEVGTRLVAEKRIESRSNVSDLIDENRTASATNLRALVGVVRDLSLRRKADRLAKELAEQAAHGSLDPTGIAVRLDELGRKADQRRPQVLIGEDAFAGEEEEEAEPLIEGLLEQGGKAILGGHAKTGKSILAMNLGLAAAAGETFFGRRIRRSRVLYIDYELNPAPSKGMRKRLKEWKRRTGKECPEGFELLQLRPFPELRDWEKLKTYLRQRAKETGEYDLIILDCLYRLQSGKDENAAGEVTEVGAHLDQIAADTGAATMTIHHTGKGGTSGKDVRDVFRGSSVLAGEFDLGLAISEHEEPDHLILEGFARDFAQPDPVVYFAGDFPAVEVSDLEVSKAGSAGRSKKITDSAILKKLPEEPIDAISVKLLAESLNMPAKTVHTRLKALKEGGRSPVRSIKPESRNQPILYYRGTQ